MKRLLVSAAAGISLCLAANGADDPIKKTRQQLKTAAPDEVASSSGMPAADRQNLSLPPAPAGVTDLKFGEFFKSPVGPRGLELTEKLQSLNGKHVRMLGFMADDDMALPNQMLLTPVPMTLHTSEYGYCDDLPAAIVTVHVNSATAKVLPHTPGLLLLTGKLSVGNQEEKNGRISIVRLTIEEPADIAARPSAATPLSAGSTAGGHHHNH
ncbi:MAG TPA: hypothetical protein VIT91_15815 [Chthoniobacterales bacterium]